MSHHRAARLALEQALRVMRGLHDHAPSDPELLPKLVEVRSLCAAAITAIDDELIGALVSLQPPGFQGQPPRRR